MKKIDLHIEELLHDHDCVIVPDFGGFITSKKPAYFNQFTSVFFPATKKILFNKHLVYNDGLLSAKIAEKQSLPMADAQQLLMQFKDDCFIRLNEEGRVEIERVGVLFFDKEKNIQFQQASTNFLKDSFGLASIGMEKIAPLPTKIKEKEKEIVRIATPKVAAIPARKVVATPAEKSRKRYGQLIPLLMLPILAAGIYFGTRNEIAYDQLNVANLNPFDSAIVPDYLPRNEADFVLTWGEIDEEISEPIETAQVEEEAVKVELILPKIDSTFTKPIELVTEKNYHVIAGCFSVKENAENLVKEWSQNGNQSSIVDKKGSLYRVAIQSFETRDKANDFLFATKKSEGISLWILKK